MRQMQYETDYYSLNEIVDGCSHVGYILILKFNKVQKKNFYFDPEIPL